MQSNHSAATEEWRPVPECPDYQVSDRGRVLSTMHGRPRVLRPSLTAGYRKVTLAVGGQRRYRYIHDLVTVAFIGPKPPGSQVRHLDGDRENNVRPNLAYGSPSENAQDRLRHGRDAHARKTHCRNGHPFDEGNTYRAPGRTGRICRTCANARSSAYLAIRGALHGNKTKEVTR